MYQSLDNNKLALGVFLDLSKAFDTVDHTVLANSLQKVGIRGKPLQLLQCYLRNRSQIVEINNCQSHEQYIQHGIPQGTVLGPVLFLIYVNDLLEMNTQGKIISFADDTVILYSGSSWENLKSVVEKDMEYILNCFSHKRLTINFDKTKYLPFTIYKNNLPNFTNLRIPQSNKQKTISSDTHVRYLGVTIDQHLRWNYHVQNIVMTLRRLLYRFKFLKNVLDLYHMKILYHALVESRIQYAILAWGGILDEHLQKLQTLQKRFIKIMFDKPHTYSSEKLFEETKILDIRQLFFYHIIIYTFKHKTVINHVDHTYFTRQKTESKAVTNKTHKTIGQRTYSFLIPHVYNMLSLEQKNLIKTLHSIHIFKKHLKKYIQSISRTQIHNVINLKNQNT